MAVPQVTIIVPCAGKSTRYPSLRPKFLLVNPNGNLMVIDSISKLDLSSCRVVITVLKEHEEKYQISRMFKEFFKDLHIQLCVLEQPTKSQSETVYKTLQQMKITGPVLIKDSDNIFKLDQIFESYSYVSVLSLEKAGLVNASNKSYCQSDLSGIITSIEEKKGNFKLIFRGRLLFRRRE